MPALTGIALGLVFGVSRIGPGQLRPGPDNDVRPQHNGAEPRPAGETYIMGNVPDCIIAALSRVFPARAKHIRRRLAAVLRR